jgi:PAS domain S-box-containing protein
MNNNPIDNKVLTEENKLLKTRLQQLEKEKEILTDSFEQLKTKNLSNKLLLNNYLKTIESLPVGIVIYNTEGIVHLYNEYFFKLFGYSREDVPDVKTWFSLAYPDKTYHDRTTQKWVAAIEEYNRTGIFPPQEAIVKCKDGTSRNIVFRYESFGDTYLTTLTDLTEYRQAENAKIYSEWRYKIISELTTDYIFVVDIEEDGSLSFQWASENLERVTGRKSNEVGNIDDWRRIIHPDYINNFTKYIQNVLTTDESINFECKSYIKSGNERWINIYAQKHKNIITGKTCIIGAVKDISQRKEAEEALKESEEKHRSLIENVNEVIYIHNKKGEFTYISPQVEPIFGYKIEELIGKPWTLIATDHPINTKSWNKLSEHLKSKSRKALNSVYQILTKNGEPTFVEATEKILYDKSDEIIGIIGSVRDITERIKIEDELKNHRNELEILVNKRTEELQAANKELRSVNEELYFTNQKLEKQKDELKNALQQLKETHGQLVQTEKMASLGILTAGVAHEINNPLNFIQGGIFKLEEIYEIYASQLKNDELNEVFKDALNYVNIGITRTNDIVKSLTRLSRKSNDIKQPCNIHSIIENCLVILNYEIKYKCTVIKNFLSSELIIQGFEGKLHQVFLNILLNAVQSMNKGTITIETSLSPNTNNAQIKITDTGKGIDPEILNKIFDPFFTTKEPGEGTGLGLSIVYSIIREHNGSIIYNSAINKGTEVLIALPCN